MAFESAITNRDIGGNTRRHSGTYTNSGGGTGGDINTGLVSCDFIILQPYDSSVESDSPVVNEALPVDGSAVTIVTIADEVGNWSAWGY